MARKNAVIWWCIISDGLIVNEEEIDNNSEIIEFGKLIAKQ